MESSMVGDAHPTWLPSVNGSIWQFHAQSGFGWGPKQYSCPLVLPITR